MSLCSPFAYKIVVKENARTLIIHFDSMKIVRLNMSPTSDLNFYTFKLLMNNVVFSSIFEKSLFWKFGFVATSQVLFVPPFAQK